MNVQRVVHGTTTEQNWAPHFEAMARTGLRLARTDAFWSSVERRPPVGGVHTYFWAAHDRLVAAMARRGIRWLPILDYSTRWAATSSHIHAPPRDTEGYAAYAGAFAARYGSAGSFWDAHPELPRLPVTAYEIWNEPNSSDFWSPDPDPARYVDLYLAARAAIKVADPSAPVLVGGLVPHSAVHFLEAMYAARPDARGQVDAVAIHPYAADVEGVLAWIASMRQALQRLGDGHVPLYVNEVGWPTSGHGITPPLPDPTRAANFALLSDTLARSNCNVRQLAPFTWMSPEQEPDSWEDNVGLYHPDTSPTLAGLAYEAAVRRNERRAFASAGPGGEYAACGSGKAEGTPRLPLRLEVAPAPADGKTCVTATVAYGGWPVNGATTRFVATSKRRGHRAKRRVAERRTDDSGRAVQCFHAPPPGSPWVRRAKVSATVSAVAASHPFTVSLTPGRAATPATR